MPWVNLDDLGEPSPEKVRLGQRLRAKRKLLGWTQTDLFERTGIAVSYISQIERAETNPSLDVMLKLAVALDEDLASLLRP